MIRRFCEDKKVLSALSTLESNEDFKLVREWLEAELSQMRKDSDTEQGTRLAWNQGACQALDAVLYVITTARSTIRSMDQNGPGITRPSWV